MALKIAVYAQYKEEEILHLYNSVGWKAYTSAPEALRKGFANSLLTLAAYEGEALQGLIRVVGDGHTVVLIQDLLVFPAYQRQGIGRALVQAVLEKYPHVRQVQLVTDNTPQTKAFYKSLGLREISEYACCAFMK